MTTQTKPLSFTRKLAEVPFDIDGQKYILRAASSRSKADWTNNMMDNSELDPETGKPTRIKNVGDSEIILLAPNIFQVDADGTVWNKPVGVEFVETLPSEVTESLYEELRKISKMDEEEDAVKK